MPGDRFERVAKAIAVVLHAGRPDADPELVWKVLGEDQRAVCRAAARAAVVEYLAAVADFSR